MFVSAYFAARRDIECSFCETSMSQSETHKVHAFEDIASVMAVMEIESSRIRRLVCLHIEQNRHF